MKVFIRYSALLFLFLFIKPIYSQNSKDSLLAKTYFSYADSLNGLNEYDSAAFYYNKAAMIYRELKDWKNVNHSEIWESYMYIDMDQYEKAIANMDDVIVFFNEHLDSNNFYSFNCSIKKSLAFYSKENYSEGIKILKNAIKIFSTNPEHESPRGERMYATAYFEYGNNYLKTGKLDSAIIMYKKTLEIRERLYEKNSDLIIDCYNNLGITYAYYNDYEMALSYMQKALKSREESRGFQHSLTAWSYTNIGVVYLSLHNFDKALEYTLKGLESRKQGLPPGHIEFGSSYSTIANIYNKTRDYEKALKYHNLALDTYIDKLGENSIHVSGIYNNIADCYNKQRDFTNALAYFKKSLKIINQGSPDINITKRALREINIADTYLQMDKIDSALIYNSMAVQSFFGSIHNQQSIDAIADFEYALKSLEQKAAIYMKRYKSGYENKDLQIANDAYLKYIELMDYLRIKATGINSKLTLSYLNNFIMNDVINTSYLLNQYDSDDFPDEKVVALIEKNKANVLQEMLDKINNNQGLDMPDSLTDKWRNISGSLFALKTEQMFMREKGKTNELGEIDEKIFLLHRQLNQLNDYIQENYPDAENRINESIKLNVGSLKQDRAIINYYISDTILYACVIDSRGIKIRTTPVDSIFQETVYKYIRGIKKNRTHEFSNLSSRLYNYLIKPVEDLIQGKNKLVIIPDKYLYYLPFETLSNDMTNKDFRTKEYLIRKFDILYHYSANFYCEHLNRYSAQTDKKLSFVGFAPVFDEDKQTVISPQCLASITDTVFQNQMEVMRSITTDGQTYNALPYSKHEINSIADLFEKQNYNARRYLYSNANEDTFKKVCGEYTIVHVASHGFINEHKSELSGIIFYVDSTQDQTKNNSSMGILSSGEMYNLNLNANLVVLSACETGLGPIVKGEGIMSMTRGLIYSGASNILFSLWKVGDKNTYNLMVDFYTYILAGDSYSKALRKSKLNLISEEETAYPKFWSGITLLGVH